MEEPYKLPDGWAWARLSDVINDFQPGFACGVRDDRGYIQLRMNNIGLDGKVVLDKTLKVPTEKTNMEKYNLRRGIFCSIIRIAWNSLVKPYYIGMK